MVKAERMYIVIVHGFRLPIHCECYLQCYGTLRIADGELFADVLGKNLSKILQRSSSPRTALQLKIAVICILPTTLVNN